MGIKEKKILSLMDEGVLSAYHLGGDYLKFRKEQIDAMKSEIESHIEDCDKLPKSSARPKLHARGVAQKGQATIKDWFSDFFYFYDFYIISALISTLLIFIIIKG
ncbi:hypothetical protein OMAG_002071 [Candidatus Omnitrophus magneticus]|uniref:Uncharacterized protein n=1 Tax=Candidatus Omnitrophus magneticus TaxID=1609969 RepID=A0A0F0CLD9_9BACT|nr:hypothetical protein OMAG_002071 [Candidatus Omnitrophus magneticus]